MVLRRDCDDHSSVRGNSCNSRLSRPILNVKEQKIIKRRYPSLSSGPPLRPAFPGESPPVEIVGDEVTSL